MRNLHSVELKKCDRMEQGGPRGLYARKNRRLRQAPSRSSGVGFL
jgi:hypothetical protein